MDRARAIEPFPPAQDPAWQRLKDLALHLVVTRAGLRGGPEPDRALADRFLASLAALRSEAAPEALLRAGLYDLGCDLGRTLYANTVHEDALDQALDGLAEALEADGVGTLSATALFHRSANLRFVPGERLRPASPELAQALVAGLLTGALGRAFNCRVDLHPTGQDRYELALGAGHNVNQEMSKHAG